MPEWIFHTEKGSEGEPRRIKERREKKQEAERGRETLEDTGRRRREREGEAVKRCWLAGEH